MYKCGKRWKAQLQSQGVQFYLGTFDSEEEAAKAYDRKARDEKGEKGQTNFDDNGEETINPTIHGEGSEEFAVPVLAETARPSKKARTSLAPATVGVAGVPPSQAVLPVVPELLFSHENSSTQVSFQLLYL